MNILIHVAIVLVTLLLQSTVLSALPLWGVYPDLILVVVVAFSLFNGPVFGARFGFVGGLGLDLMIGEMVGLNAVTKMLVGAVIGAMAEKLYKENYLVPFLSVVAATLLDQLLYWLGATAFGMVIPWSYAFHRVVGPLSLYNGVLILIVYVRLHYLNRRILYWDELAKRSG